MSLEKYRNQVVVGDSYLISQELPDNSIDLVLADPDYNVGIDYHGESYTRPWDEYIEWYGDIITEFYRVMKPDGNMFIINYPRQNAYLRVKYLDALAHDIFDYVWVYYTSQGHASRRFSTAHRSILHVVKSDINKYYKEHVQLPYRNLEDKRIIKRMRNGEGRNPYSWLKFNVVMNVSQEKTDHPCQIPQALNNLLIKATTVEGDLVFIPFGGGGGETISCKLLNRDYITCDIQQRYVDNINRRLSDLV